jgi:hypothetical protein
MGKDIFVFPTCQVEPGANWQEFEAGLGERGAIFAGQHDIEPLTQTV